MLKNVEKIDPWTTNISKICFIRVAMDAYGHGMMLVEAWTWQAAFLDRITSDPTQDDQNMQDANPEQGDANPGQDQDQLNPDQGVLNPPNLMTRIEIGRRFHLQLEELERRLGSIID